MDYYIERICSNSKSYYRVITDIKIPFPQNYIYLNFDNFVELSNVRWNKSHNNAWGKPDKVFIDVEIYNLWANMPILTFDEFLTEPPKDNHK